MGGHASGTGVEERDLLDKSRDVLLPGTQAYILEPDISR